MASTTDKKMILSGAPMAWALGIYDDETSIIVSDSDTSPDFRMLFDNIQSATCKIKVAGTETNTENLDVNRADGAIIRFPKYQLIIDGTDDTQTLTDVTKDENATNKAEITIVTNEADYDSTTWTDFLNKLRTYKDKQWLVCLPTGFNYANRIATVKKADGFIYMLGKLSSDIELQMQNSPTSVSLTFVSYKFVNSSLLPSSLVEDLLDTAFNVTFPDIALKGTSSTITPEDTTGDDSATIGDGDIVIKKVSS